MSKKIDVTNDIYRGVCTRCSKPPSKFFHLHVVKVVNREPNEEEWLCNKHARRYNPKIAKQLTNMDLPVVSKEIK